MAIECPVRVARDNSKRGLTAAQLTPAPRRQAADCQAWLWTAIGSRSSAAAVWRLNIITAIPGQSLIEKFLAQPRRQALPPPCSPAHGPHMYTP
jgi:hypothetical protein